LHVVGGGELNQRPLSQEAAKRLAILLGVPEIGWISRAASNLVSAFRERSMSVSSNGATIAGGAHAKE